MIWKIRFWLASLFASLVWRLRGEPEHYWVGGEYFSFDGGDFFLGSDDEAATNDPTWIDDLHRVKP